MSRLAVTGRHVQLIHCNMFQLHGHTALQGPVSIDAEALQNSCSGCSDHALNAEQVLQPEKGQTENCQGVC